MKTISTYERGLRTICEALPRSRIGSMEGFGEGLAVLGGGMVLGAGLGGYLAHKKSSRLAMTLAGSLVGALAGGTASFAGLSAYGRAKRDAHPFVQAMPGPSGTPVQGTPVMTASR